MTIKDIVNTGHCNTEYKRKPLNKIVHIRNLYTPIQPTVRQSADNVIYAEFLPDSNLQNYIYCYWQLKTVQTLSEQFNYSVVADGCIDIFFELNNPFDSYVMGFCKTFTEFPLNNAFNYIGIRFLPSMFPQLFKINAKELSNKFQCLDNVIPAASSFIENNISPDLNADEIKAIFDNYFLQLIAHTSFDNDNRFYEAVSIILKNFGVIDIEKDLNTGISQRQLRRLFEFYIGDTAKTFSKVVRFQNILKAKPSSQILRQNKLFFDVGYYDQAHFIKEFKNFYGVTPSKAFGR
jgi:AraC-like DNA-binding protein